MKRNIYNYEESWSRWLSQAKDSGIKGVNSKNTITILHYLRDMELGINVGNGSHKGPRTVATLNGLSNTIPFFARILQERYGVDDLANLTEEVVFQLFADLHNGAIRTAKGKLYESPRSLVISFKAFWHWYQKVNLKKGIEVPDITADLGSYKKKPKWVYLNEEQAQQLGSAARFDYRVLFSFILDGGTRPPGELLNIKVNDLSSYCKSLNIRDEIAKVGSHGRTIKLMLCSELLKQYIKMKGLRPDDYLFDIKPAAANKYIKVLAVKLFGDGVSPGGKRYSEMRLYDLRHISACYWVPRYKTESALMYRFGWTKSKMIRYYTEFLGMRDTISEEDLLVDVTKTELERRISSLETSNTVLRERLKSLENTMIRIDEATQNVDLELEQKLTSKTHSIP